MKKRNYPNYPNEYRDRKGKLRTWLGHLRMLSKIHKLPIKELRKRVGH